MPKVNEATDNDLRIVGDLQKLGRKPEGALIYQQKFALDSEQQKHCNGRGKFDIGPAITHSIFRYLFNTTN